MRAEQHVTVYLQIFDIKLIVTDKASQDVSNLFVKIS